jgi:ech hydrogenase subunit A
MREHESHLHLAKSRQPQFFGFLLLFLGAMNGLLLANNLLVLYFFWEVTTLCCVLLIGHDKTPEAIANSTRALWMNLLGGVAFVAALVYLGVQGLPVSLTALIEDPSVHSAALIPAALLAVAGFTKAAQMPFQGWLLGAMVAPTPVSALLHSSTMVKAGVYLVLRMTPVLGASAFVADAVAIAGAFTFVVTAMIAVSERNAKKVLAYSTISNLGLIIACAGLNTAMAYSAAVMLIIFHAVSKALLFMGVGTVEQAIKSRMIEDMEGLISKLPVVTAAMVIGILSMLLPPFGVLVAKWAALEASANLPLVMVMFVLGSAFTVAFWTKWVGRLLERTPGSAYESDGTLPALLRGPIVVLAVAAIGLSLLVSVIIQSGVAPAVSQMYLEAGYTGSVAGIESAVGWFPVLGITIFLFLAVLVPVWLTRGATEDETSVYACGENLVEEGRLEFRSDSDKPTEILVRGYYFDKFFGEQKHLPWATAVGAVLLLVVLGAALPL